MGCMASHNDIREKTSYLRFIFLFSHVTKLQADSLVMSYAQIYYYRSLMPHERYYFGVDASDDS